jgi:hypothetical protein
MIIIISALKSRQRLILIDLFNNSCRDQGQQDFMVTHQVYAPTAFGGGTVDYIGEGTIMVVKSSSGYPKFLANVVAFKNISGKITADPTFK